MNVKKCSICGSKLVKNGKTSSGKQRWLCKSCKQSSTANNKNNYFKFCAFLNWLLSKKTQQEQVVADRTFRLHNEEFWKYWAMPEFVDEVHKVIFCDGIYLSRNLVILIACSKTHVLSWYLARSENSNSWAALLGTIVPPDLVVTDGGTGFKKAVKKVWGTTAVQRCTFHVSQQIRRYTTQRPRLRAGKELLKLSRVLTKISTLNEARLWIDAYLEWSNKWYDFLQEKSRNEYGQLVYTHERLRKARNSINSLLREDTLFTYLNPMLSHGDKLPATNNVIEGMVNSQLREVLRNHRGLPLIKRAKACFWWCYLHAEYKLPIKSILKNMPTDQDIDDLYSQLDIFKRNNESLPGWGDGIVWNEFHTKTPYPFYHD